MPPRSRNLTETERLQSEALSDWLACLIAERLGRSVLDVQILKELESTPGRAQFIRRLVERLRLSLDDESVRSDQGTLPGFKENSAGDSVSEALKRALA
jgi:hypothetical protein